MTFRDPELLWLLLLLLAPLLLYLLPLPRQRVFSSAMFLWEKFLQAERFGRTSERFRRALGFALVVAILTSLILAAAELTVGRSGVSARNLVVLVDVSASMNAVSDGRSNLEQAKTAASELIASLDGGAQVALAEAGGQLRLLAPFAPAREAVRGVEAIERFDGPGDLARMLGEAYRLWGGAEDCEIYVFSDGPLPDNPWAGRAHAWIAPPAGDNAAIIALAAERRGPRVAARFTLANYGRAPRALKGTVLVNDVPRGGFECPALGPGETVLRTLDIEEPRAAVLRVRLDGGPDALAVDDEACAVVPGLEELAVRLAWPDGGKHNAYVSALLASLGEEGTIGPRRTDFQSVTSRPAGQPVPATDPITVYVDQSPAAWPEGGAIVLYPLRSGAVKVAGLSAAPVTVTRQATHFLLDGVDLRGLVVKDAVRAEVPVWAEPLVWAGDLPLVWAGTTGKTKVLFVAAALTTTGSRLPLLASFPALVRNACRWMLPQAEVRRAGEESREQGAGSRERGAGIPAVWSSRRAGLVESPVDGRLHAFSTLSAAESDLRREPLVETPPLRKRQSLAAFLVALAMVLLPIEWRLFHRRLTE